MKLLLQLDGNVILACDRHAALNVALIYGLVHDERGKRCAICERESRARVSMRPLDEHERAEVCARLTSTGVVK